MFVASYTEPTGTTAAAEQPGQEAGQDMSPGTIGTEGEGPQSSSCDGVGGGTEAEVEDKGEMPPTTEEAAIEEETAGTVDGADFVEDGTGGCAGEQENEKEADAGAGKEAEHSGNEAHKPQPVVPEPIGEARVDEDASTSPAQAKKISDEPLPAIQKPPASPTERVALDRMLAQHDDFKFDRAAEVSGRHLLRRGSGVPEARSVSGFALK